MYSGSFTGVIMRLLVSVFLLLIASFYQQSKPSTPTTKAGIQERNAQTKADHVDEDPAATSVGPSPKQTPHTNAKQGDPYDPRNDSAYRAYLWFTIAGVIGGLCGIGVLIRQSSLLRESVNAAHKSADALMDAEAAFITIKVDNCNLTDHGNKTIVIYPIRNIGRSVATIFSAESFLHLGDSQAAPPDPSIYDSKQLLPSEYYLPPSETDQSKTFLSPVGQATPRDPTEPFYVSRLTPANCASMENKSKALWSYGFVRYRDIFGRKFELRFCHRWETRMAPSPGFMIDGPVEFNRLTRYA
jgi:hypothetical protein